MKMDSMWTIPEAIIDCNWLKDRYDRQDIRVYDCTSYLHYTDEHPSQPYDVVSGFDNYSTSHIPNAAFLDLQQSLSDSDSPYRFTIPALQDLADRFKKQGVGDPFHIILYSANGMQWATRIWWMLYAVGYEKVSILNGGFAAWQQAGLPTQDSITTWSPAKFEARIRPNIFVGKQRVLEAIADQKTVLLNALTRDLHLGESARYGRPGRIPTSINIPFSNFMKNGLDYIRSASEAQQILAEYGLTPNTDIVNYCGGGIAATLNAFVMLQLGFSDLQIYDNSMSEWAMDHSLAIETG
jgi:thiosulfate/3-mercaptopyruvate sulfurtransferase